jgi:hypothetical protein
MAAALWLILRSLHDKKEAARGGFSGEVHIAGREKAMIDQ